jgi:hypothetical protein
MAEATVPASLVDAVEAHLAQVQVDVMAEAGASADGRGTAAAVLDVLRASGWIDAQQAQDLQRELERLRELLNQVVRAHRAREAEAAAEQIRQRDWLIPLLQAADGMEQGTLEAKAALRAAVQQVPADLLADAGLRPRSTPLPGRGAPAGEPPTLSTTDMAS